MKTLQRIGGSGFRHHVIPGLLQHLAGDVYHPLLVVHEQDALPLAVPGLNHRVRGSGSLPRKGLLEFTPEPV